MTMGDAIYCTRVQNYSDLDLSSRRHLSKSAVTRLRPSRRRSGRGSRPRYRWQRPVPTKLTLRYPRAPTSIPREFPRSGLAYQKLQRHNDRPGKLLRTGLLNIRSFNSKTENALDLFDEHCLNLLILTETTHENADSVVIKKLRIIGLNVIEAARDIPPNTRIDNYAHFVSLGGNALVSKSGISIAKVETKMKPKTSEHLCCRVGGDLAPSLLVANWPSIGLAHNESVTNFSRSFPPSFKCSQLSTVRNP